MQGQMKVTRVSTRSGEGREGQCKVAQVSARSGEGHLGQIKVIRMKVIQGSARSLRTVQGQISWTSLRIRSSASNACFASQML